MGRAANGDEAKQHLGGEEYFHQFHSSDFVLYNESPRRLPPLADRPPTVKPDVNSNYLKVSRSNSRLTSTLKKLLPRRKTSKTANTTNNSEVNLTGIYNNNKYIIKVNSEPEKAEKSGGWVGGRDGGGGGEGVRGARVNRNKSFLLGAGASNKVKRSNSVLPAFLGRGRQLQQDNRTVVEVGGGGRGLQQFPWAHQEKAKESGNDNNGKNNNRYVICMPTSFWGEGSAGRVARPAICQVWVLNLPRDMLSAALPLRRRRGG